MRVLDISHNLLTSVPSLQSCNSLTSLSLSYNKIQSIKAADFIGLEKNLASLDLSNNNIQVIEPGAFKNLSALTLEGLDLSGNPIADGMPYDTNWLEY